jgi:hypothetical protein
MLELKKVTIGKDEKRAHICLPCPPPCWPYYICSPYIICSPAICIIPYPDPVHK